LAGRFSSDDFSDPIPESWREEGRLVGDGGIVRRREIPTADSFDGVGALGEEGKFRLREKRWLAKSLTVSRFLPFVGETFTDRDTFFSSSAAEGVGLLRTGSTNSCENRLLMARILEVRFYEVRIYSDLLMTKQE
jgi:hypothetical protein